MNMGCSASTSARPSSDADEKVRQVAAAPVGNAETEKTRRAKELGINASAVSAASGALAVAARSDLAASSVRIFQFNVLADGLSGDGFLVRDVLDPPVDASSELESTLMQMDEAKRSGGEALEALKQQLCTARAEQNHKAVTDWGRRWAHIKELIAHAQPDVICLQEFDHMADAGMELEQLGYSCTLPNASSYQPAHAVPIRGQDDLSAYTEHLNQQGRAFAPSVPSSARKIALEKNPDADDDGVAIFWRSAAFACDAIDFHVSGLAKGCSASVRASLTRVSDGKAFYVLTSHLPSGDDAAKEAKRLGELTSAGAGGGAGLADFFAASVAAKPTIYCLDANSSPERTEDQTVWKTLRGVSGAQSVWDADYAPDGVVLATPPPVSTNKMRGPLSQQASKVGLHAYYLIDHVYYSQPFKFVRHALPPLRYESKESARTQLLPSLAVPSDHAPVIVDFELP